MSLVLDGRTGACFLAGGPLTSSWSRKTGSGKEGFTAILDSAASRLRPIILAAATTILGLIPLLTNIFFVNISITIMAGLGFASNLTLIVTPVLYSILFRIPYAGNA